MPQGIVDQALLSEIDRHMDPRVVERALELLWQRQEEYSRSDPDRRQALERELIEVDRQVEHLVNAIARGEAVEPLLARLKAQEVRKRVLAGDLQAIRVPDRLDRATLLPVLRAKLADVQGLLHRHPSQARQVLRKLVEGHLTCQAVEVDGVNGYRITGWTNYLPLLPAGMVVPTMVASPIGPCAFQCRI